jgi:hypothetical protein
MMASRWQAAICQAKAVRGLPDHDPAVKGE